MFKDFKGARNAEMTGGSSVACVHDPRSGQKRYTDADEVIEGGSARTVKRSISCRNDGNRFAGEQDSIVVSLEQAFFVLLCLRFWAVHERECGRRERGIWEWGSRVGCSGESCLAGDSHVVLVPISGDCSSINCMKGGQLQR